MKTPLEIADERISVQPSGVSTLHLGDETVYNILPEHADVIRKAMVRAVEADRAQRDDSIHAAVIAELHGRALNDEEGEPSFATSAAEWIDGNPDEFWEEFAFPMLEDLEGKFR